MFDPAIMPRTKVVASSHAHGTGSAGTGSSHGSQRPSARPPSEPTPAALAPPASAPRKIIPPRYVNFGEITPLFLMICELLAHQGWISFFSSHQIYYPPLVQEFYGNMVKVDEKLVTFVRES